MHDDASAEDDLNPRWLDPPHDPRWELEPRWNPQDREQLARRKAEGPGLASARTEKKASEDDRQAS